MPVGVSVLWTSVTFLTPTNQMTQTVNVRFSYGDKVFQEIPIHLGVDVDLTNNKNKTRLLNRLLKSNSSITEVSLIN